jgi:hypothetical protein
MFGTFPSLIHSVSPRIPDSEYTVQQRCLPFLRRAFHNNRPRVLIAWLTGDFKSGRRGPGLFRSLPYREIKQIPSSTGSKSPICSEINQRRTPMSTGQPLSSGGGEKSVLGGGKEC